MRIVFIGVGPIKKGYILEGVKEYAQRIKRYADVESINIKEERVPKKGSRQAALKKEAARILERTKKGGFAVVLAEQGRSFTSRGLSDFIERFDGGAELYFITGGPFGLHKSVTEAAGLVMSLSEMTLPHDMARLVLTEQVYRAFTIIRAEPYSH